MNLEKLFGSKTKVDIMKYLLFKREGISMRALENDLTWTFPAIKKQVDSLEDSGAVHIEKSGNSWSIRMNKELSPALKNILLLNIKKELMLMFDQYEHTITHYFFGTIFGVSADNIDLIVIYKDLETHQLDTIKRDISIHFQDNFISQVSVVFMSLDEWSKRYRLADRFVLNILRCIPETKYIVEKKEQKIVE